MDVKLVVKSMTGYGRDIIHIDSTTITVEIRTVNHRFLDFAMKIPSSLLFLEDKIKEVIKTHFLRGRIEVFIKVEGDNFTEKELKVDWNLMDQYIDEIKKAQDRYNLTNEIPTSLLSTMTELFTVHETEEQSDKLSEVVLECVSNASKQVMLRREQEGLNLLKDIKSRIEKAAYIISLIKERQINVLTEYKSKIHARIEEHLKDTIQIDDTRLIPEIALLAEKGDITEEITRLESHIEHFYKTIGKNESVGRTIDFIAQEMQRETNTIGAKSLDVKTSEWVVLLKGENEKVREQTQNIE